LEASSAEKTDSLKEDILEKVSSAVAAIVSLQETNYTDGSPSEHIAMDLGTIIPFDENSTKQIAMQMEQIPSLEEKINFLNNLVRDIYESKEKQMGEALMRQVERFVELSVIDNLWMDHLDAIDNLRQGIGLRGYGQKDPLVEYKNEAFIMFEKLINAIDDEIVHRIYKIQVQEPPEVHAQHMVAQAAGGNSNAEVSSTASTAASSSTTSSSSASSSLSGHKPGRNDPCWCGSGKKYKKCHYPN